MAFIANESFFLTKFISAFIVHSFEIDDTSFSGISCRQADILRMHLFYAHTLTSHIPTFCVILEQPKELGICMEPVYIMLINNYNMSSK